MIGIGIDTGGTYTDAVIYDLENRHTLCTSKALTTHHRLELGILNALDTLDSTLLHKAQFLSLSTTLATNACVEGIGGRTKLIFINVEPKTVLEMHEAYGLPHPDEIYFIDTKDANWQESLALEIPNLKEFDSLAIVQIFAQQDNAKFEKKVRNILKQELSVPCICGHDLFQDLNVLRRGSSALLNARLIPVIQDFIAAINIALKERGLALPIVIVRSDGSLMSLDFALEHPVETLLCGPAASIIAGTKLTDQSNALVVDMGGTTSDIAIIENNLPVTEKFGISIGTWKTFVKGLYVDTFGLGGDSAVRYSEGSLYLDSKRVIPLCMLASEYPYVVTDLEELTRTIRSPHPLFLHEFFVLLQDISEHPAYSKFEKELCQKLKDGPLIYQKAAAVIGKDLYGLRTERLENDGIIMRSGLTPTDIMHIKGDFTHFNTAAAKLGADFVALCTNNATAICDDVYQLVEKKLYCNLVRILLKHEDPFYEKHENHLILDKIIEDSYDSACQETTRFCHQRFSTKAALIGIGAPIHIFLDRVAKLLGTKAIFPEHAGVANALGAVIGNVNATFRVLLKPIYTPAGISEYLVYGPDDILHFDEYETAKEAAIQAACEGAKQAAKKQGAADLSISFDSNVSSSLIDNTALFLEEEITGRAIGRIIL